MLRVTKNNINISWDENYDWKDFSNIVLKSIFSTLKFESIEKRLIIDVYFIDNNEMKKLNDKHLGNNYETDVLSFNYYEGWKNGKLLTNHGLFPGEENLNELGELFLSIPKILQQAKENDVSSLKELSTMAIHGTLHLLGYNHEVLNEEKIMFSKTDKILEGITEEF
ncbi:MAG: rRNA maturation RNase YbeY [Dehalococcoidia bacterium]|nr:rRNA maturation RNase YbeY [Dehalococcoidia bacterium]|tara:strand:+ start:420 stop:920 length:501 start_codon:yes stop_codon:yes gene_type:complete